MFYSSTEEFAKQAFMKSRKGRRPARVHTLVDKESAGVGWQAKNKKVRSREKQSSSEWLGSLPEMEKKALIAQLAKTVMTKAPGVAKSVAKTVAKKTPKLKLAPKSYAPAGAKPPSKPLGAIKAPQPAAPTVEKTVQLPSPARPARPQPATPKTVAEKAPARPVAKTKVEKAPARPQPVAKTEVIPSPGRPAPAVRPAAPPPAQPAAAPAAKAAPAPAGYAKPTPELQQAVRGAPTGDVKALTNNMAGMPVGQQYEVLTTRRVHLNNAIKSGNPATAAAARGELKQVDGLLKQVSKGTAVAPVTAPGPGSEAWKQFKRYAVPIGIGGGLIYGGSQVLGAGQQGYASPYAPQGY